VAFDPCQYFDGQFKATGCFIDRKGVIRRRFDVDIVATPQANGFVLDEDFLYDDGETESRRWIVTKTADHHFTGKADGVIGEAAGYIDGNALIWRYQFALPVGKRKINIRFDDVMVEQPDGVLVNRARLTKWGIWVGDVLISFHPQK
tara:strand:+ start:487 stop:927 length:441 start_codon:yes stop_codon:yes gene_type:complete